MNRAHKDQESNKSCSPSPDLQNYMLKKLQLEQNRKELSYRGKDLSPEDNKLDYKLRRTRHARYLTELFFQRWQI